MSTKQPLPKNKREYAAALKRAQAAVLLNAASHFGPHRSWSREEVIAELKLFAQFRDEDAAAASSETRIDLDGMIAGAFQRPT